MPCLILAFTPRAPAPSTTAPWPWTVIMNGSTGWVGVPWPGEEVERLVLRAGAGGKHEAAGGEAGTERAGPSQKLPSADPPRQEGKRVNFSAHRVILSQIIFGVLQPCGQRGSPANFGGAGLQSSGLSGIMFSGRRDFLQPACHRPAPKGTSACPFFGRVRAQGIGIVRSGWKHSGASHA